MDTRRIGLLFLGVLTTALAAAAPVDLTDATVVVRPGILPKAEQKAAVVLVEEVEKRTGLHWAVTDSLPDTGTVIVLAPDAQAGIGAEGYRLSVETSPRTLVRVTGADARGVLYGVGKLLRSLDWSAGAAQLPEPIDVTSAPVYRWRGHQLGYRNRANSYDAWDEATYEQYIRELVIFGANAIENIPFQDDQTSPHNPLSREEMNVAISRICDDHGIEYWVWTPVEFDLANSDPALRDSELARHEALYEQCPRVDGVFVPGGDPGNNPPDLVLAFVHDLHDLLVQSHPEGGVWMSNQGFGGSANDTFFDIMQTQQPDWFAGVVFGPGTSISIEEERSRTPQQYPIRHYPDITHNVRCQYPVFQWDRAFAHTENREASNPRPTDEALIHNLFAPSTNGFISYSDGAHDDVNKQVWSMRGWDPDVNVKDILRDYARFFFGPGLATDASAGIQGLELNWDGPLSTNDAVDETFALWRLLESGNPSLAANWRWQFCLLRAYYDKYLKERLAYEASLETQANVVLEEAPVSGADAAMDEAEAILDTAVSAPVRADLRTRIGELGAALFQSIGYQSSIDPPYLASDPERSCVLDFVDWPLNNRFWLTQEFARIRALGSEEEKLAALDTVAHWEDPGPGGFYDDLGCVGKQPHLVRQEDSPPNAPAGIYTVPTFVWHQGNSTDPLKGGGRLSWQDAELMVFGQPLHLLYSGLAPDADYFVRATYRTSPPSQVTYPVPGALTASGTLDLTWDVLTGGNATPVEVWLETPDSDEDGLPDYWEARYPEASTPDGDPDGDGLTNPEEFRADTNPLEPDTDGDGYWDNVETTLRSDPTSSSSTPAPTGVRGDINLDSSADALDVQLAINGALGLPTPYRTDINNDQRTDAFDVQSVINGALGLGAR